MRAVLFHPEAEVELQAAAGYYEQKAAGLGEAFLEEVEKAISRILNSPETWPVLSGPVRRCLLKRFPYGVLYRCESRRVFILAIMHLRRKPGYWRGRR